MRTTAAMALLVIGCGGTEPTAVLYGPGEHWIDDVVAGEVSFTASSRVEVDIDGDGTTDLTFDLTGEASVWRSDAYQGNPADLGHRNRLDLEIVTMQLAAEGLSLRAGDGLGNGRSNNLLKCLGSSTELAGDATSAADRFELFFEVTLNGEVFRNTQALVVESTISQLPPLGSVFVQTGAPIPLIDDNNRPTNFTVVRVEFTPLEGLPDG